MPTFLIGKVGIMPTKYDAVMKAKAVRLVREHRDDYASEWAAITTIAGRMGMTAETLRKWVRESAVDEVSPRVSRLRLLGRFVS
jgi:transposase